MSTKVQSLNHKYIDDSGRFYMGMTKKEAEEQKVGVLFERIDTDKDGILSYDEMWEDRCNDIEIYRKTKKQCLLFGCLSVLLSKPFKSKESKAVMLINALIFLIRAMNNSKKLKKSEQIADQWMHDIYEERYGNETINETGKIAESD